MWGGNCVTNKSEKVRQDGCTVHFSGQWEACKRGLAGNGLEHFARPVKSLCKNIIFMIQIAQLELRAEPAYTKQHHQRNSTGGNGLLMTGVLSANLTSHFFHRVLATLSKGPCHCTAYNREKPNTPGWERMTFGLAVSIRLPHVRTHSGK